MRIRHVYGLLNFYAGVGTRLRNTLKTKREILDPAVSDILDAALSQTMRDYYESVFARHAFYSDALKKIPSGTMTRSFLPSYLCPHLTVV